MLTIGLENVEEIIFSSRRLQQVLPEFKHLFASWTLSRQVPALRSLGKRCLVDFLNELTPEHLAILEKIFGTPVEVRSVDVNVVRHAKGNIDDIGCMLDGAENYFGISLTRTGDTVGITMWR